MRSTAQKLSASAALALIAACMPSSSEVRSAAEMPATEVVESSDVDCAGASPGITAMSAAAGSMAAADGGVAVLPTRGSVTAGRSDAGTARGEMADAVVGIPSPAELATLRQVCVDAINVYRATLPMLNLAPYARATPDQEACADEGIQSEADGRDLTISLPTCRSLNLHMQNRCFKSMGPEPATASDALESCLKLAWQTGEPDLPLDACAKDNTCFFEHGSYLAMRGTYSRVACAFYRKEDGSWLVNQNFF